MNVVADPAVAEVKELPAVGQEVPVPRRQATPRVVPTLVVPGAAGVTSISPALAPVMADVTVGGFSGYAVTSAAAPEQMEFGGSSVWYSNDQQVYAVPPTSGVLSSESFDTCTGRAEVASTHPGAS